MAHKLLLDYSKGRHHFIHIVSPRKNPRGSLSATPNISLDIHRHSSAQADITRRGHIAFSSLKDILSLDNRVLLHKSSSPSLFSSHGMWCPFLDHQTT
ncbi:hypothetical protein DPMN_108163 [Dreissena polymorpha]|uniref:Uncharacterized protein n=1 Tax=Dreissena polymorpha TaxID=45954 RepID=A0A9D4K814_DREPO|nr:hypothetical protein DPMN_108163 [Dreissena polymorpha]